MLERTAKLWEQQDRHTGDRLRLFAAVSAAVPATRVLYPGSYVDLAPSFVWPAVTYVDMDRRAAHFFADIDGVAELIERHGADPASRSVRFLAGDYREPLPVETGEFDLLVSLYAGFVSEFCTDYLRVGGALLVNPSHGDAAMAAIDPRYELFAVVASRAGRYSVSRRDLEQYLVPKDGTEHTSDELHQHGRGIAYTRSPFAYLFRRVE